MAFTSAQTMWASIVLFFLSLFISMLLIVTGGTILDAVHTGFLEGGVFNVPEPFGIYDTYNYLTYLYYGGCILLPIICFILMVIAVYNKYVLDREEDEERRRMYPGGDI